MGSKDFMKKFIEENASRSKEKNSDGKCISRISNLLDEDSFVEINSCVKSRGISFGYEREKVEGDGVVTGYGSISGKLVFVAVQDPEVYAGSVGQMHAAKIREAVDLAIESNSPFIVLLDSGGTRIEEGVLALEGMAEALTAVSYASEHIPTIAAVVGHCTGGCAMLASLCNLRFMTKEGSGIYMNGPMVTASKAGKMLEPSEIGGSKIHSAKTGLASFVLEGEENTLEAVRDIFDYIPGFCEQNIDYDSGDDPNRTEKKLDDIAYDLDSGYSMKEILENVFDKKSLMEVSCEYAQGVMTAFAKLGGCPVGIVANKEKRIDSDMAKKIKSFIEVCDVFDMPLFTFVDCSGYAVGMEYEHSDLIRSSAQLYRMIGEVDLPKISVIIGEAIGTGYLTMASKQNGFDFTYAWPTATVAVTTPLTAANVLYKDKIAKSSDVISSREDFVRKYTEEVANAKVAASLGHVDEIIAPSSTRPRLISSLQIL